MKLRWIIIQLAFLFCLTNQAKAQVYNMVCPPSPTVINSCTGNFYDAGGSGANYPNNQNCVYTFCSNSPGECLMVNFTSFNVNDMDFFGNPYDYLGVYEGPSTASPLIYYIWGGPFPAPFPVASSGTCLTFEFISDGSARTAGWAATLNCQPCPIPTAPTQQDCNGAIPICQEQYYQPFSFSGNNGSNILPGSSCIGVEQNNSWYVFNAQTSGPLSFVISPNFTNDDYDFALYDISTGGCPGITTGASPEISCNWSSSVGPWAGQTGAYSAAPYLGTLNTQGAFGTAFNASPPVVAGNTYALVINNYSSSQGGYYLDLTPSSATLFDNVIPAMDAISPVPCGSTTVTINFSEPILCSSLQASDFTITGGPPTTVSAVAGANCGGAGTFTQSVVLTVSPALSSGGPYTVNLVGTVADLCGNDAVGSQNFSLSAIATAGADLSVCGLMANLLGNNPSPGSGIWTQVSSSSGGSSVFGSANNFSTTVNVSLPGVYTYQWTVTIGACVVNDQVTITFLDPPNAGSNALVTLCSAGSTVDLFTYLGGTPSTTGSWSGPSSLPGGHLGSFDPAIHVPGIYTYTVIGLVPCPNFTATVTVSISPLPTAIISGTTSICSGGNTTIAFSGTPNAIVTYSINGGSNQTIVLNALGNATLNTGALVANTSYDLVSIVQTGPPLCSQLLAGSAVVSIVPLPVASFSYSTPFCSNGTDPFPVFSGAAVAGAFSSTAGLVFISTGTGQIDLSASTPGLYTITNTIVAAGGCPLVSATTTIEIFAPPDAGTNGSLSICINQPAVNLFASLGGSPQTNGAWSGPSILGGGYWGTFDPAVHVAGNYTYTVNGMPPCLNGTAVITVTVDVPLSTSFDYPGAPFCTNFLGTISPQITGNSGGTFSVSPAGLNINSLTGIINPSLSAPGTYTVSYQVPAIGACLSYSVDQVLVINSLPVAPLLTPLNPCAGVALNFNATGGSFYEFTINGLSQGAASSSNALNTGPLPAGDQVCVKSFPAIPFNFNGLISEPEWGNPFATSAGGPATSGFGPGNNLDAIFLKNAGGYLFGALASNVVNNSNNRILLFIDCQSGGFNTLGAWINRSNAPYWSVENLSSGITFDAGFTPEYVLAMNQATANSYFDLYNMVNNTNLFLGDGNTSNLLGFVGNAGVGDFTKGFEFAIPMSLLGSPISPIKVFAMLVNDPGFGGTTNLSNQFLTCANPSELNYGTVGVNFGSAAPNPIVYPLSADCFSQACVTVVNSIVPTFNPVPSLCAGQAVPLLPAVSLNGISGTWNPAAINNTTSGSYTFTPDLGQCANSITINVVVQPSPTISTLYHD